ncbi:hypothetical protein Sango_1849000 [Sesamum angolense]|uniref:Uncharacterized protein n=1 Tax=Sesamum angolense TaxID=2727404 RepID=A0AAE2BQ74_9LAMI|nr:hypothetical protein Sango_1849000 [Sesamum angolense]
MSENSCTRLTIKGHTASATATSSELSMQQLPRSPRNPIATSLYVEAALYVVNTRGVEEALRIFTEGLEPVVSCAQGGRSNSGEHNEEDGKYRNNEVVKIPAGLRDIVSAPF